MALIQSQERRNECGGPFSGSTFVDPFVGHNTLDDMVKHARAGHTALPTRGPRLGREKKVTTELDLWFLELYQLLAEPLALPGSGGRVVVGDRDHEVVDDPGHPLLGLSLNTMPHPQQEGIFVPKRYLNFATMQELWNHYKVDVPLQNQCSRETFRKRWPSWCKFMPLKDEGQGQKCNECVRLAEARLQAVSKEDRAAVDEEKRLHLSRVMADREVNTRGNKCEGNHVSAWPKW